MTGQDEASAQPIVVHSDRWLVVVDKPPGMPVQSTRDSNEQTTEAWILGQGAEYVALHHRLDQPARGLLVVAVHPHANKGLAAAFAERTAIRRYRALVHGRLPSPEGTWRHRQLQSEGRRRAVAWTEQGSGKDMLTRWRRVGERQLHSELELQLHTGRTHQIRLQSAAEGHPIVGDRRYGLGEGGGLRLQAFHLSLDHPVTGEPLSWQLERPAGW